MLLVSSIGAMMLSGTGFLRKGLGFSAFMLFSNRVKVRGSWIIIQTKMNFILIIELEYLEESLLVTVKVEIRI